MNTVRDLSFSPNVGKLFQLIYLFYIIVWEINTVSHRYTCTGKLDRKAVRGLSSKFDLLIQEIDDCFVTLNDESEFAPIAENLEEGYWEKIEKLLSGRIRKVKELEQLKLKLYSSDLASLEMRIQNVTDATIDTVVNMCWDANAIASYDTSMAVIA